MKNFVKIGFALLLAVVMCCGIALAEGEVRYEGQAAKFVFLPGDVNSDTNLFGESFANVLPGDTLVQKITVKNTSSEKVRIYMRAEAVDAAEKDFLNQLHMTVEAGDTEIFDAQAGEKDGLAGRVLLGGFKKNGSTELTVTLTVPSDLGNEYMGKVGYVPWTFIVEEIVQAETPDTGDWFAMPVWLSIAALLMAAIVVVLARRRKAVSE